MMNKETLRQRRREDRTLDEARRILERRADEEELRLALSQPMRLNLRKIAHYSAFYSGYRRALVKWKEWNDQPQDKDYRVELRAILRLATSSLDAAYLFSTETPIAYRGHKRDRRGKLTDMEAYYFERVTVMHEVPIPTPDEQPQ